MSRVLRLTLAATSAALALAQPAPAQRELTADELVADARRWAGGGDTALAIASLRKAVSRSPDHPEAVLWLGRLLARTAPFEESDFRQRAEADGLLERAYDLTDGDPRVLLELGLLRRRQNVRVDARRLLEDALDSSRESGLDATDAAEAHYALARIYEEELEAFQHLLFLGPDFRQFGGAGVDPLGGTASATCPPGVSFFCYNYTRSEDFNRLFEEVAQPASDRAESHLPRIESHYRTALSHDPTHRLAARGLMAFLLRESRFAEFRETADRLIALTPHRPYPYLFRGLALYRAERWEEARFAFEQGLALLEADERIAYQDVGALLDGAQRSEYRPLPGPARRRYEDVLWAKSDPLYLVPGNERWLEHVARVTYAELNFGVPALGLRGWESDRGLVWIRYGEPRRVWMIDTATRLTSADGGRWILWNYRLDAPSFIFRRQAGYRSVRFDFSANTSGYVDELAQVESPSAFRSRAVRTWVDLPYQIARLRGDDPELTDVVAWVEADPSRFLLFDGDSVRAALFLFAPQHADSAQLTSSVPPGATGNVMFTTPLYPSEYEYAIEALARESRVAGSERGSLSIPGFPADGLTASDLVVADGVRPRTADPRRWSDFSIGASRDLAFGAGEEIHLYFEIYGLEVDGAGEARYRLELTVQREDQEGLVSSVVRSLGGLVGLGGDAGTRVRFDRRATPRDGVVAEYLSLTLTEAEPGTHQVRVTVRDRRSGEEVQASRAVTIETG